MAAAKTELQFLREQLEVNGRSILARTIERNTGSALLMTHVVFEKPEEAHDFKYYVYAVDTIARSLKILRPMAPGDGFDKKKVFDACIEMELIIVISSDVGWEEIADLYRAKKFHFQMTLAHVFDADHDVESAMLHLATRVKDGQKASWTVSSSSHPIMGSTVST
jgi:hypothetical protein